MTVLERLKLELNNKEYFTNAEYKVYLEENNLVDTDVYIKISMQRDLLYTVTDILESVANDVDLMRKVETEFSTTSEAIRFLNDRIDRIRNRILNIPETEELSTNVSLLFTRG
ncbi:hypothetical protein [Senegalia massiliensis]|uniref:Uncharacterized protein n=1 Tax=Senegalia massiliensis TaxID=1720316 RepID=A0A845QZK4_9CLOT|nr:hypothetical protein [Senegalia massiliensis]NBI06618.1 hypothetical protein [Senegalia massiliensis]